MTDHMIRILTLDGAVRVSVAATTLLVEELRRRQQTDPTATVAIGRLATAAALMGSLLKGGQRTGLTVEGNGPLQRIQAETDAHGHVRATLKVAHAGLPPRAGRYDVAGAVGQAGFLHVVKDLDLKEPYRGMVRLVSSEIAEDLAYYFTTSEQTPSSVALGVELGRQAEVVAAGGYLLQLMPDADDTVATLKKTSRSVKSNKSGCPGEQNLHAWRPSGHLFSFRAVAVNNLALPEVATRCRNLEVM